MSNAFKYFPNDENILHAQNEWWKYFDKLGNNPGVGPEPMYYKFCKEILEFLDRYRPNISAMMREEMNEKVNNLNKPLTPR